MSRKVDELGSWWCWLYRETDFLDNDEASYYLRNSIYNVCFSLVRAGEDGWIGSDRHYGPGDCSNKRIVDKNCVLLPTV